MNVPAEVNGIAPWEPTVATTVAAADLSRPHPSHPHLGGIRVGEEVLPHPTDLKYPEAPAAPGCPYSPLQLAYGPSGTRVAGGPIWGRTPGSSTASRG